MVDDGKNDDDVVDVNDDDENDVRTEWPYLYLLFLNVAFCAGVERN